MMRTVGTYDIQNTTTKMIIINNHFKKVSYKADLKITYTKKKT